MANGYGGGQRSGSGPGAPVSRGTELRERGAINMAQGFALAASAGLPSNVQNLMMVQGSERGKTAAENIRNRYYREIWKQIKETRIDPVQNELAMAQRIREEALRMTTVQIGKTIDPGEAQAYTTAANIEAAKTAEMTAPKPVKGADGKPVSSPSAGSAQIPNSSLTGGPVIGATALRDAPAYIDPINGPVAVDTPAGIAYAQNVESDFFAANTRIQTKLMDIAAEYSGNPYADQYMQRMMQHLENSAGFGATGKKNPQDMATHWGEVQELHQGIAESKAGIRASDASVSASRARTKGDLLTYASNMGRMKAGVADARMQLEQYPEFGRGLSPEIIEQIKAGTLPEEEMAFVAGYARLQRMNRAEERLRIKEEGGYPMTPTALNNGRYLIEDLRDNDPGYASRIKQLGPSMQNERGLAAAHIDEKDPEGSVERIYGALHSFGATRAAVETYVNSNGATQPDNLTDAIEMLQNDQSTTRMAHEAVVLERLPMIAARYKEFDRVVTNKIEEFIIQKEAEGAKPEDRARMEADRWRTFFEASMGYAPVDIKDPWVQKALLKVSAFYLPPPDSVAVPGNEKPAEKEESGFLERLGTMFLPPERPSVQGESVAPMKEELKVPKGKSILSAPRPKRLSREETEEKRSEERKNRLIKKAEKEKLERQRKEWAKADKAAAEETKTIQEIRDELEELIKEKPLRFWTRAELVRAHSRKYSKKDRLNRRHMLMLDVVQKMQGFKDK